MEFHINITVNSAGAVAGADRSTAALARTEARANSLQRSLVRTFLVFGAIRAIKNAVQTLSEFSDAIKTVQAVSGASASDLQRLSEAAQELGINTRFSAVQAAEGLVTLARAGFDVRESQQAIAQVLNLAVAGATSLKDAADITATALRSFGIAADESGRVTDVLTLAANSANTTVTQLGQGLKFVGPIARGLNVSFEQTSAALATLSDAGLKATLAGTGFRRILAELESPTTRNIKRFAELGLTTDELKVSQVGLTAALTALSDAGVTAGDALRIFGQRGGPAFEVLVRNIPEIEKFTVALENAGGTAQRTADIIDSSLKGALIRVESAFKGFIIAAGETGPTNALTAALNGLSATFRVLAENAEIATIVLGPLFLLIATRGIAAVLGFNAAFAATNPLLLAGAALIGSVSLAFAALDREVGQIARNLALLEEEVGFAKLGASITSAQRELNSLRRTADNLKKQGIVSDAILARIAELESRIASTKVEIRDTVEAQKELAEAQKNAPFEKIISGLERERALLSQVNDEKRTQNELDQLLDRLAQGAFDPTGAQKDLLEAAVELNQSLRDQKKILEEIDAPFQEFNRKQAALEALMIRLPERTQEFKDKLKELREELIGVEDDDPFEKLVLQIQRANQQLELRNRDAGIFADAIRAENTLRDQGIEITSEQRTQLQGLFFEQQKLNEAKTAQNKKEQETAKLVAKENALRAKTTAIIERNNEVAAQADVDFLVKLKELGQLSLSGLLAELERLPEGPTALNAQLTVLREQLELGEIGIVEFGRAVENLGKKGVKDLNTFEKGLANLSLIIDQISDAFANQLTDAVVNFVETGKFNFREFAESLISSLLRIIVKLLIIKALEAAGFGGSGTITTGTGGAVGGKQRGGTVQPDRSFIVGEDGPELFTPGKTGTITPNAATFRQEPPVVNVQNVVVQNENMVPEAIASGAADKALITRIGALRDQVNKVTGNA